MRFSLRISSLICAAFITLLIFRLGQHRSGQLLAPILFLTGYCSFCVEQKRLRWAEQRSFLPVPTRQWKAPRPKEYLFSWRPLPRQCGIATFTSDVCGAVATAFPQYRCVGAVNGRSEGYDYPDRVRYQIITPEWISLSGGTGPCRCARSPAATTWSMIPM
jgi:hypothetical protein